MKILKFIVLLVLPFSLFLVSCEKQSPASEGSPSIPNSTPIPFTSTIGSATFNTSNVTAELGFNILTIKATINKKEVYISIENPDAPRLFVVDSISGNDLTYNPNTASSIETYYAKRNFQIILSEYSLNTQLVSGEIHGTIVNRSGERLAVNGNFEKVPFVLRNTGGNSNNKLSYNVDGTPDTVNNVITSVSGNMLLIGSSGIYPGITVRMAKNLSGRYDINAANAQLFGVTYTLSAGNNETYSTSNTLSMGGQATAGYIEITSNDTLARAVTGIFDVTVTRSSADFKHISNGVFNIKY